jgi:hypothetical protein
VGDGDVNTTPKQDWRDRLGRPSAVVLFRTPAEWRFAVYFAEPGGVLDGALTHEPAASSPESAQAAMHHWVQDNFQQPVTVTWTAGDQPEWWTGTVQPVPNLPSEMGADLMRALAIKLLV